MPCRGSHTEQGNAFVAAATTIHERADDACNTKITKHTKLTK